MMLGQNNSNLLKLRLLCFNSLLKIQILFL